MRQDKISYPRAELECAADSFCRESRHGLGLGRGLGLGARTLQPRDGSKGSPRAGATLWGLLPTAQITALDKHSAVGKRRGNTRKDSKGAEESLTPKINHILSLRCLWQELGQRTINDGEGYQVFKLLLFCSSHPSPSPTVYDSATRVDFSPLSWRNCCLSKQTGQKAGVRSSASLVNPR